VIKEALKIYKIKNMIKQELFTEIKGFKNMLKIFAIYKVKYGLGSIQFKK
jgi:hypothetical protein